VIAVDTNILVYAHRKDQPFHERAAQRVAELAQGRSTWAIPWPCLHEFLAVVTNLRVYKPPTPMAAALDQVEAWRESPSLVMLAESEQHWSDLRVLLIAGQATGARVHDARVAAICLQHGVHELWSADRDFGRFPSVRVINPLID
jgi:toxin-antitoxin system PIN domain toxin